MSSSWQDILYGGLQEEKGRAPPVYSGMITKSLAKQQLSEIVDNSLDIISENLTNRNISANPKKHKHHISAHRAMGFLPHD